MNLKQLAFLPDDIPLRLGPPIRLKPKVEVTPAPPFMVEALERIEDTCLNVSGNAFDKLAEQFKSTNYASASPSYHSGGVLGKTAIQEERMRREIAKHLRNPQPTHGSVTVVINESTPIKKPKAGPVKASRREHLESVARNYMFKTDLLAAKKIVARWSPNGKLFEIPDENIEDAIRDFEIAFNAA